jgi:tetratricopeptide (TPR) repeat protein
VARAYEAAFGTDRALQLLLESRAGLGGDALALAIGDVHASSGDMGRAVVEWAKAIAPDGSNVQIVRRRVETLTDGRTEAGRNLIRAVSGLDAARGRWATRLAIELGLGPEALDLVRQEADGLSGEARTEYLQEISVMATAAGVAQVASWAYAQLGGSEEDPAARRLLEQRRAEAALAAGDTTAALDAFDRVARSLPAASMDRRAVEARAIRVAAAGSQIERLRALWNAFRGAHDGAAEFDALAATTAAALIAWGDVNGAVEVLDGVEGPRSAIERAYMLLGGGEIEAGRATLMEAVGGLPPAEATEVIQLAGLLGRVSPAGAAALSNAGVQAHLGRGGAAASALADRTVDLPVGDRALLLAEAARIATRSGARAEATDIRERLVEEYPDAPEVGEASLALARDIARYGGDTARAIRLLEDLITSQPNAAVVPEARLELERLRSRGS